METTHTPPNSFRLDCGCVATNTGLSAGIAYCPLHRAAPELLDGLEGLLDKVGLITTDLHITGFPHKECPVCGFRYENTNPEFCEAPDCPAVKARAAIKVTQ